MRDVRLELIDAAYRFDLDDDAALDGLLDVYARSVARGPLVALATRVEPDGEVRYLSLRTRRESAARLAPMFVELTAAADGADLERLLYSAPGPRSLSSIVSHRLQHEAESGGLAELFGLNCPSRRGTSFALGTALAARRMPTERDRAYWGPVARQLAAAFRLRHGATWRTPDAVIAGDGAVVHAAGDAPALLDRLRHAMLARERARSRRGVALWPELVAGRWTLADRFESDGRRYVIACRNEAAGPALRALSARQRAVLELVARGDSNKAIAIELGVSEPTVSRIVRDAFRRLGTNLAEVVELIAATRRPAVDGVTLAELPPHRRATVDAIAVLSPGERAVVQLAIRGHSNAAIARARRSAPRTVINQLRASFEKLGVRSRRELVLRFA
jgi:DNA-binding NarL/FixJ family response regulator